MDTYQPQGVEGRSGIFSTKARSRMRAGSAMLALLLLPLASAAKESPQAANATLPQSGPGTIGLVLTDLRYSLYETTDGKEECPSGFQVGEVQQFKAMPGYMEHLNKFGGTFHNRGPNGEMGNYMPHAVSDPIPFKELSTKKGFGFNLDGTTDGRATAKSCKHDKFTSPSGEQIDNQMARVFGCAPGWRKTGFTVDYYSKEVETLNRNRLLIEVTGVDSETNDPSVNVAIYKGRDRVVRSASGNSFVPFMSHRIDDRFPQYTARTKGKIVDGVLITQPIPFARMSIQYIQIPNERHVQDMVLRLKLRPDGAEGMMGGYEKLSTWWNALSKNPGSDVGRFSPPALYKAAHRYADGYPDPKTGQCTAISVAYDVAAVRALIVHPPGKQIPIAGAPADSARPALARN